MMWNPNNVNKKHSKLFIVTENVLCVQGSMWVLIFFLIIWVRFCRVIVESERVIVWYSVNGHVLIRLIYTLDWNLGLGYYAQLS